MSSLARFDVVVVGGGASGSSAALLLRRRLPNARILVVERAEAFDKKVGESTVEGSAYFFSRVLGLTDYLAREQLTKQGFRYWFSGAGATRLKDASEVGPYQLARVASFQVDREKLDEHLLALAKAEGVEVWRPARVVSFEIPGDGSDNCFEIEIDGERRSVASRWAVDASGRAALFAQKMGTRRLNTDHPTAAIWARMSGVRDLDASPADDSWGRAVVCSRRLATNHFTGHGYWWWFIPLRGGETSVGIVWDKRFAAPADGDLPYRFWDFARRNPLVSEMLDGARIIGDDIRGLGHLPYFVDRCCGRGWAAVGDAAGFLDPFYSPGLDHVGFSVSDRVALIVKDLAEGGVTEEELERSNRTFRQFFDYFFRGIYQDKYEIMGDYELMSASFLLDTSLYYRVLIWHLYREGPEALRMPPFGDPRSGLAFRAIRFYNQRLVSIARSRRLRGTYGRGNAGRRPRLAGFSLDSGNRAMMLDGFRFWLAAEASELAARLSPRWLRTGAKRLWEAAQRVDATLDESARETFADVFATPAKFL